MSLNETKYTSCYRVVLEIAAAHQLRQTLIHRPHITVELRIRLTVATVVTVKHEKIVRRYCTITRRIHLQIVRDSD